MSNPQPSYVLVTGATGFIGAHIVDTLLAKGVKVKGATRSLSKGKTMLKTRSQYSSKLDFVEIQDFENPGGLEEAVKDVDAIIHTASPLSYDTTHNEKELIIPALNGVRAVFSAAATNPDIRRIVMTSSFASVMDVNRKGPPYFEFKSSDWNPLSYEEAAHPSTSAVIAYRGAKKYAELEAWKFVEEHSPSFDLVTFCPPMTFGPVVHPVDSVEKLNESNSQLWKVANGHPLPVSRVPLWVDVRDLATAHVEALFHEKPSKRYTVASPEFFNYALAARIMSEEFPNIKSKISQEQQDLDESYGLDGKTVARDLGFEYHSFRDTIRDFVAQAMSMSQDQ